ncbi:hypothetical protein [Carboxylicivirga sp. M1479]|uniref:hypothetical protein n=1 Tax=Carboxylicivirga sp. M1479 TaxID=2594476 RepID=UPI00117844D1|nr:hypothetical protein [Carboxylicivirga sp. M1479]TRX70869.1 hypothetical protein FNN09_09405 [Carboxylicivirga sp. M1479]
MAKPKARKKRTTNAPFNKMEAIKPFIIRLHELCKAIDCDAMQYITSQSDLLLLANYRFRIGSINNISNDYQYTRPFKSIFNKMIKDTLKHRKQTLTNFPISTSFEDVTYLDALTIFLDENRLKNKALSDMILSKIKPYYNCKNSKLYHLLQNDLLMLTFLENLPDEAMLSIGYTPSVITHKHGLFNTEMTFQLYLRRPIKENIEMNSQKRTVFQVYIPLFTDKLQHKTSIKTHALGSLYNGNEEHLYVYIQAHALQRLRERVAPYHDMYIKLHFSLLMLKSISPICRSEKLFIPYKLNSIIIGYFVAVLIVDKVVIKTFILATHASAPEGRKFQQLTGFRKHDMSYWDITKLDTFIYNNMTPDNALYPYFKESGLLPLFDLDDKNILPEDKSNNVANWQHMLNCISKQQIHKNLSQQDFQNTKLEEVMV